MKKPRCFVFFLLLAAVASGCQPRPEPPIVSEAPTAPANVPSKPVGEARAYSDISGEYLAEGNNADGGEKYRARLVVTRRGNAWQFSWQSGTNRFEGVGVAIGDKYAVGFAAGEDAEGCGAALYQRETDGTLRGVRGFFGKEEVESDVLQPTTPGVRTREMVYRRADSPDVVKLTPHPAGFALTDPRIGATSNFALETGEFIAVSLGGSKCSLVWYQRMYNGWLTGRWGNLVSQSPGIETAKRR